MRAYNDSRISLIESEHNFKYFGRFQLALAAKVPLAPSPHRPVNPPPVAAAGARPEPLA